MQTKTVTPVSQTLATLPAAETSPEPIIVVSNRQPFKRQVSDCGNERLVPTVGGLTAALEPVMSECGGHWVASEPAEASRRTRDSVAGFPYSLHPVPIDRTEHKGYYENLANRALWPLCHHRPDLCRFNPRDWHIYENVNRRFADAVSNLDTHGPVWVHDYHFALLPANIRSRRGSRHRIIYFHHIPFPPATLLKKMPWWQNIIRGLAGADVIGFHTPAYVRNFLAACSLIPDISVDFDTGTLKCGTRQIAVGAFPISIDWKRWNSPPTKASKQASPFGLRQLGKHYCLSVDRLDYSKGILERIRGIDRFFHTYPEFRGRVIFQQVLVPSRTEIVEYRNLRDQVMQEIGKVNAEHGSESVRPIEVYADSLEPAQLKYLYASAAVLLVTSLRDGMNLVAKEFCASRPDEDGVLVLSQTTGAADCLRQGAVLIDPRRPDDIAYAIYKALRMPFTERRRRMAQMRWQVRTHDLAAWTRDILTYTG